MKLNQINYKTSIKKSFKIKKNPKVGVVFPAGWLLDRHKKVIESGLNQLGMEVKWALNHDWIEGYLAGGDKKRGEAFMDVWLDPSVDIVWAAKGGYGSSRMLRYLDFEKISKTPKIFIGMSDITAIHYSMRHHLHFPTILGPNLSLLFPLNDEEKILPMRKIVFEFLKTFEVNFESSSSLWMNPDVIEGELVGGNLALINSLIGTGYFISHSKKVLLLEDVNEPVYKIDRMLFQLDSIGALENLKGLILASFHNCQLDEDKVKLSDLFHHYFSSKSYPTIIGFPSGHIDMQIPLLIGEKILITPNNL